MNIYSQDLSGHIWWGLGGCCGQTHCQGVRLWMVQDVFTSLTHILSKSTVLSISCVLIQRILWQIPRGFSAFIPLYYEQNIFQRLSGSRYLPSGCWSLPVRLSFTDRHWTESALGIAHCSFLCFPSATQVSATPTPQLTWSYLNSSVYSQGHQLRGLRPVVCLYRGLPFWKMSGSVDSTLSSWGFIEDLLILPQRWSNRNACLATFVILEHDLLCSW